MAYLIPTDYNRSIQASNLQQVISADQSILNECEKTAIEEIKSYLRQKYDVSQEFNDTSLWSVNNTYLAGDVVYLSANAFSDTTNYTSGSYVLYNGNVYVSNQSHTGAWNPAHFDLIAPQYTIYTANYPNPIFNYTAIYRVGDVVFWKDKIYTCKIATAVLDNTTRIQYDQIDALPYPNVFPDDIVNGLQYWGAGVSYSIAANTLITNTTKWTQTDSRDAMLVQKTVDIMLYHVHQRIAPQNIPQLRVSRYMGMENERAVSPTGDIVYPQHSAIGWLQACARGFITPNIPPLQPYKGGRIRYGGKPRDINNY